MRTATKHNFQQYWQLQDHQRSRSSQRILADYEWTARGVYASAPGDNAKHYVAFYKNHIFYRESKQFVVDLFKVYRLSSTTNKVEERFWYEIKLGSLIYFVWILVPKNYTILLQDIFNTSTINKCTLSDYFDRTVQLSHYQWQENLTKLNQYLPPALAGKIPLPTQQTLTNFYVNIIFLESVSITKKWGKEYRKHPKDQSHGSKNLIIQTQQIGAQGRTLSLHKSNSPYVLRAVALAKLVYILCLL